MNNEWMKARQTRYGAFVALYVIVILAIVVTANWLADHHNKSVDVTSNKKFTLSDQTKKITGNLKRDVNIYYFNKSDSYDSARDIFDRYKNLSPKIKVNYVDPDKKPDVARFEGARAMGDIIVDNGEKKETAKGLTEEELTGALVRVSKSGARMVCFVNGSGEHTLDDTGRDGYSTVKGAIERNNYKTQTISLIQKPEVPKDCNVVVVAGPKRDYLQPALDALKTYIQAGGHVLFNFDANLKVGEDNLGDTPQLDALVSQWGVTVNRNVVVDIGGMSRMLGPFNPIVGSYESHPIVRVMSDNATAFPLSSSLDVKSPAEKLFSSSADSYALVNPKLPIKEADLEKGTKGPFTLGAAATIGSGASQGRIIVVGSSGWMANTIMQVPLANRDLALNMMNWMTSDEELISIRPKDPEDRRLHVTGSAMRILFLTSVIFLPLIVIFSGVSVWWKRR